jgi:hypothetical protein
LAIYTLLAAVLVIVLDGVITQLILLRDFPGLTFFIQRLLLTVVFVFIWTAWIGMDRAGWLVGSLMLALLWTTYSMYLGPRRLPSRPPTYSGYTDLWLKSLPGAFVSAVIGAWLAGWLMDRRYPAWRPAGTMIAPLLALAVVLTSGASFAANQYAGDPTKGLKASARASGQAVRVTGPDPGQPAKHAARCGRDHG